MNTMRLYRIVMVILITGLGTTSEGMQQKNTPDSELLSQQKQKHTQSKAALIQLFKNEVNNNQYKFLEQNPIGSNGAYLCLNTDLLYKVFTDVLNKRDTEIFTNTNTNSDNNNNNNNNNSSLDMINNTNDSANEKYRVQRLNNKLSDLREQMCPPFYSVDRKISGEKTLSIQTPKDLFNSFNVKKADEIAMIENELGENSLDLLRSEVYLLSETYTFMREEAQSSGLKFSMEHDNLFAIYIHQVFQKVQKERQERRLLKEIEYQILRKERILKRKLTNDERLKISVSTQNISDALFQKNLQQAMTELGTQVQKDIKQVKKEMNRSIMTTGNNQNTIDKDLLDKMNASTKLFKNTQKRAEQAQKIIKDREAQMSKNPAIENLTNQLIADMLEGNHPTQAKWRLTCHMLALQSLKEYLATAIQAATVSMQTDIQEMSSKEKQEESDKSLEILKNSIPNTIKMVKWNPNDKDSQSTANKEAVIQMLTYRLIDIISHFEQINTTFPWMQEEMDSIIQDASLSGKLNQNQNQKLKMEEKKQSDSQQSISNFSQKTDELDDLTDKIGSMSLQENANQSKSKKKKSKKKKKEASDDEQFSRFFFTSEAKALERQMMLENELLKKADVFLREANDFYNSFAQNANSNNPLDAQKKRNLWEKYLESAKQQLDQGTSFFTTESYVLSSPLEKIFKKSLVKALDRFFEEKEKDSSKELQNQSRQKVFCELREYANKIAHDIEGHTTTFVVKALNTLNTHKRELEKGLYRDLKNAYKATIAKATNEEEKQQAQHAYEQKRSAIIMDFQKRISAMLKIENVYHPHESLSVNTPAILKKLSSVLSGTDSDLPYVSQQESMELWECAENLEGNLKNFKSNLEALEKALDGIGRVRKNGEVIYDEMNLGQVFLSWSVQESFIKTIEKRAMRDSVQNVSDENYDSSSSTLKNSRQEFMTKMQKKGNKVIEKIKQDTVLAKAIAPTALAGLKNILAISHDPSKVVAAVVLAKHVITQNAQVSFMGKTYEIKQKMVNGKLARCVAIEDENVTDKALKIKEFSILPHGNDACESQPHCQSFELFEGFEEGVPSMGKANKLIFGKNGNQTEGLLLIGHGPMKDDKRFGSSSKDTLIFQDEGEDSAPFQAYFELMYSGL